MKPQITLITLIFHRLPRRRADSRRKACFANQNPIVNNPTDPAAAAFVKALRATDGRLGKIFVKKQENKQYCAGHSYFDKTAWFGGGCHRSETGDFVA